MKDRLARLSVIIANFSTLENRLSECLDFLPYSKENKHVVSPRFVPIILDACSLIDSVLRHLATLSNKRLNFKQLAETAEKHLELETAISIFLISEVMFLNPFKSWKTKTPAWWTAYNRLKHDRLNHYSEATYENAVMALCGLHQVVAKNHDFIPNLISAGWFYTNSDEFRELILDQYTGIGTTPICAMPVESRFFVAPLNINFIEFNNGRPFVIDHCPFSPRVLAMISAVECVEASEMA